jgi:hypothetical protein
VHVITLTVTDDVAITVVAEETPTPTPTDTPTATPTPTVTPTDTPTSTPTLTPQPSDLTPGYYDQTAEATDYRLGYDGAWSHATHSSARDGTVAWSTTSTHSATFSVIPDQIAGIVLYHWGGSGHGTIRVCHASTCHDLDSSGTTPDWGSRRYIDKAVLGLSGSVEAAITIQPHGDGWIGLEGLQIVAADPADADFGLLEVGISVDDDPRLRYINNWTSYNRPLAVVRYSKWQQQSIVSRSNSRH